VEERVEQPRTSSVCGSDIMNMPWSEQLTLETYQMVLEFLKNIGFRMIPFSPDHDVVPELRTVSTDYSLNYNRAHFWGLQDIARNKFIDVVRHSEIIALYTSM